MLGIAVPSCLDKRIFHCFLIFKNCFEVTDESNITIVPIDVLKPLSVNFLVNFVVLWNCL